MASDQDGSVVGGLRRRDLGGQQHEQLDELLEACDQVDQLPLIVQIGSGPDLDATLRQIFTAAIALTGARYCALGMGGLDGPLAGSAPHVQPLRWIANRARELTDAEQAIVLVPTDPELLTDDIDALVVSTAVGSRAAQVIGQQVPVVGSTIGDVFRRCTPVITDTFRHAIKGFTDVGERPALVTPLRVGDTVLGVIAIARNPRQPRFDTSHLDLVSDFAGRAAMALTAALAHACEHELAVLADRERIAHDLHDHVIDRLFAAGMDLQATIARCGSPEDMERLTRTVDDLQSTIDDIRTTVFRMQFPAKHASDLRQRIQTAVGGLTADRDDITTTMRFVGPMSVVGVELADHVEAVITEAVTNAVRHSRAYG